MLPENPSLALHFVWEFGLEARKWEVRSWRAGTLGVTREDCYFWHKQEPKTHEIPGEICVSKFLF